MKKYIYLFKNILFNKIVYENLFVEVFFTVKIIYEQFFSQINIIRILKRNILKKIIFFF